MQVPDTTPPSVTIASPSNGQVFPSGTTSVTLSATTNENALCRYDTSDVFYSSMLAGNNFGQVSYGTSFSTSIAVSDGNSYVYHVSCIDTSGNQNSDANNGDVVFSVASAPIDSTPPMVTNIQNSPASPNETQSVTITATATDTQSNIQSCQVRVDGGAWNNMNADDGAYDELIENVNQNIGMFGVGGHTAEVRCTDSSGNTNSPPASHSFTVSGGGPVDNPPYVSILPVQVSLNGTGNMSFVMLTAYAGDDIGITEMQLYVYDDRVNFCPMNDTCGGVAGPYSPGTVVLYNASATDTGSHQVWATGSFTVTAPGTPGVGAPSFNFGLLAVLAAAVFTGIISGLHSLGKRK